MNLGIATDVANSNFAGAVANPDFGVNAQFYWEEPINKWESERRSQEEQRRVVVRGEKCVFIRISVPGNNLSVIEEPAQDHHKQRFPRQWQTFQVAEGMIDTMEIPGWKIEDWPEIAADPENLRHLRYLRFQTVEQIAGASDSQVQGIGMGGLALREKARRALGERVNAGTISMMAERDAQIDELKRQNAEMLEKMNAILAAQGAQGAAVSTEKPKRGRKFVVAEPQIASLESASIDAPVDAPVDAPATEPETVMEAL